MEGEGEEEGGHDPSLRKSLVRELKKKWELAKLMRETFEVLGSGDGGGGASSLPSLLLIAEQACMVHCLSASSPRFIPRKTSHRKNKITAFLAQELGTSDESWANARELRIKHRMPRPPLRELRKFIKDRKAFQPRCRGKPQAPPEYQLLAFLACVGTEGDGMPDREALPSFPNGAGSSRACRKRCPAAIIEALGSKACF